MRKALIISNNSGGGHRQTSRILVETLSRCGWHVETVSIYEDIFADDFRVLGIEGEDFYNKLILTRETTGLTYRIFFICAYYFIIQPNRSKFAKRLAEFWLEKQPDLIISVIPLLNQTIARSLSQMDRRIPFVIAQTDLFEFHEPFWLTPTGTWFVADDKTYTVVGTDKAYQQVMTMFVSDQARVFKLSGNIVDPRFLERPMFNRKAERERLGLDPDKPVGLCLYGSFPPNRLLNVAKTLNKSETETQFIFVCGKNEWLRQRLSELETRYNKVVVGYTSQIPCYMHLSDFLIGKSGPGTIMEGLAAGLPLLIDTRKVITHESNNMAWVERHGFGVQFRSNEELLARIEQFASDDIYNYLKKKVSTFENKAIFEIPAVIETVMTHCQQVDVESVR